VSAQLVLPVDVEQHGEIRLYRLLLPFLPPSKNVYDTWPVAWKAGVKRKWVREIERAARSLDMPLLVPKIGLAATLVFPSKARRDPQNYAQALWNWVPDGLVSAGVIADDVYGRIDIPGNWGLKFDYDLRPSVPKTARQRTVVAVSMVVD
jgi:hypothetical protein